MTGQSPRSKTEIAVLAVFALTALAGLFGVTAGALIPDASTGQIALQSGALCLGPMLGSLGALAMVWLRNRARATNASLIGSILLWLTGLSLLGFGIFTAFTPGERSWLANLGYSVALCFTPGGMLTLLGLGLYWYGQWRKATPGQRVAVPAQDVTPAEPAADYATLRARAAQYRQRITDAIRKKKNAAYGDHLARMTGEIGRWEDQVERLVSRLTELGADPILQRDMRQVPEQIAQLERELAAEPDPAVRQQMAGTLAGCREQQAQLDDLAVLMRRTRLQLDQTLAAMGTIYSQVQTLGALEVDSSRARRISEDIDSQVNGLADLLSAVAEVDDSSSAFQRTLHNRR